LRDVSRAWQRIPWGWKKFVVLALAGWLTEALFGFGGLFLLLLCLFLLGLALALLNPGRGKRLSDLAIDQIGGQVADVVSLPLLLPVALEWWAVARSHTTDRLAPAVGYAVFFFAARVFLPYAIRTAFEPGAWSGGKRRRRARRP
jgi:hypothetical protein